MLIIIVVAVAVFLFLGCLLQSCGRGYCHGIGEHVLLVNLISISCRFWKRDVVFISVGLNGVYKLLDMVECSIEEGYPAKILIKTFDYEVLFRNFKDFM